MCVRREFHGLHNGHGIALRSLERWPMVGRRTIEKE
jgi:hypothetical protein